ncbi:MAG: glycoside hydrolase family 140 protein [Bacteroidota bacterium]
MVQKLNLSGLICLLMVTLTTAQIKVSENQKFLSTKDGKPFFWLGDTDWELFHRMTREEAEEFIAIRSEQGFNVLQAVALAEFNGIREPNRYGDYPLNNEDPTQLLITPGNNPANAYEYDYWDHVDFVINKAAEKGMYIGLLPTWGDKVAHMWGDGPIIFTERNAETYGSILAKRYAGQWNIIWILGGDRPVTYQWKIDSADKPFDDHAIWRAMAKGIEDVLGKDAFITYHPSGGENRTSHYIHNDSWMDMNAFQSGHGSRESDPWRWVKEDLAIQPQKPTLDMEPCYEDHPVNPWDGKWTRQRGYFTAYDVRARIYRGVFAGTCGVTYGHHQIWQFLNTALYPPINSGDTIIGWRKAARSEAASQMKYLKNLMLSRPYFSRVGDQTLIKSDIGSTYIDLVYATRDENKSYAMIYLPQNLPVKIDVSKISGSTKNIWWYNVRTGVSTKGKSVSGSGIKLFTPPKDGKDWVLIVDDSSKGFKEVGE